jgi:hypothetical protein
MGFHADQEAVRVLALSLDETRRGQASLPGGRASPGPRTTSPPPPQVVSPGSTPGPAARSGSSGTGSGGRTSP